MSDTIAIVDCRIPRECEAALCERGFRVLTLPPHPSVGEAVSSHADMLVFKLGNDITVPKGYTSVAKETLDELVRLRPKLKITEDSVAPQKTYPHDCKINALVMGDKLFCKADTVSEVLLDRARKSGLKIIPVKQGYPACTTLKITSSAAITSDRGMARVLAESGIHVTLIENGGISLPPYSYGFIGGACGVFDGKAYFFGDPAKHPSGDAILDALEREGVMPVALYHGELIDLGGIVFA